MRTTGEFVENGECTVSSNVLLFVVIVSDVLVLFTGVVMYWLANVNVPNTREKALHIVSTLLYPGFVLIDHGHFQYVAVNLIVIN